MTSIAPVAALTSLLVEKGWTELGEGPAGRLWGKGEAESPIPFELRTGSSAWTSIISAVADVEHVTRWEVEQRLDRYLRQDDSPVENLLPQARSELDLHLDGPGIRNDHEANAYDYGKFVATFAETVKELVKENAGIRRHTRELQIVGGAGEGSVQITMREPLMTPVGEEEDLLDEVPEPAERRALLTLTQILNASEAAASSPSADSPLDSHLNRGPAVRSSIARLAKIMLQAGWITHGRLTSPSLAEDISVTLTLAGCVRLQRAASAERTTTRSEKHAGVLDAWSWSTATAAFQTDEHRTIRAAVPIALQQEVAQLIGQPGQRCLTTFQILERQAPNGGPISRTYAVSSIELAEKLTD